MLDTLVKVALGVSRLVRFERAQRPGCTKRSVVRATIAQVESQLGNDAGDLRRQRHAFLLNGFASILNYYN